MRRCIVFASVVAALIATGGLQPAQAQCAFPFTLVDGQPLDATQVMANFNALAGCMTSGGSANAIQYNSGTGSLAGVGPLTDGQVAIGATSAAPQAQTLTAGAGIAVTSSPGNAAIATTAGTAGTGLFRQVMTATPTSAGTGLTTWLNQGSSSVSDSAVGVSLNVPSNASISLSGRYMSAPTPPYTITALLSSTRNNTGGFYMAGIGWYDGTAKLQVVSSEPTTGFLRVRQFTNPTTTSTINFTSNNNFFAVPIWLQIKDDGTNVSFSFSQDGVNFLLVYSVAKASGFLGVSGYSKIIFFANPGIGLSTLTTLLSWAQT